MPEPPSTAQHSPLQTSPAQYRPISTVKSAKAHHHQHLVLFLFLIVQETLDWGIILPTSEEWKWPNGRQEIAFVVVITFAILLISTNAQIRQIQWSKIYILVIAFQKMFQRWDFEEHLFWCPVWNAIPWPWDFFWKRSNFRRIPMSNGKDL